MTSKAVTLGADDRWHLVDSNASDRTVCGMPTSGLLTGMGGEDMATCQKCLNPGGISEPIGCDPPVPTKVNITVADVAGPFMVTQEQVNDRVRLLEMRDEWRDSTLSGFCAQQGRTAGQVEKEAHSAAILVLVCLGALALAWLGWIVWILVS